MHLLKPVKLILPVFFLLSLPVMAAMEENPLLYNVFINEMESDDSNSDLFSWDAQGWAGKNINKLWLKTEGERVQGETESAEFQALYSRAVGAFWDVQAGIRHDAKPTPEQNWAVIGLQGLAPYYFEIDTAFFIGESGNSAWRFNAEYELLFTQRLILTPEIELNAYGQNMPAAGIGSGLAEADFGLRLRYEIRREFAPYVGFNWTRQFGETADFSEAAGLGKSEKEFVIGLRLWF